MCSQTIRVHMHAQVKIVNQFEERKIESFNDQES